MTSPENAVTVAQLREHLDQFDEDAPIAVKASGAYDFLDQVGLDESGLNPKLDIDAEVAVFLNGDRQ